MVLYQKPNLIFTVGMISGVSEGRHSLSIWIWIWNAIFRPVVDYLCQIFQLGLICSCWPPPSHQKFWSAVVNLIRVSWAVKYYHKLCGSLQHSPDSPAGGGGGRRTRCPSHQEPHPTLSAQVLGDVRRRKSVCLSVVCHLWRCCTLLTGLRFLAIKG